MAAPGDGTRGAGEDDVAAPELVGVAHERGHLGRAVALVEVDAARVDDDRHAVERADRGLEPVTGDGARVGREPLDVLVRNAAHGLHEAGERTKAAAKHDGHRVLHARAAPLDDVLINHDDPLPLERPGAQPRAAHESPCEAPIVDQAMAAGGALGLQDGQRRRALPRTVERHRNSPLVGGRHVGASRGDDARAAQLRGRPGASQPAVHLGTDAHDAPALLAHAPAQGGHGSRRASATVIAAALAQQTSADDDVHVAPRRRAWRSGWWRQTGCRSRSWPTRCSRSWQSGRTAGRPRSRRSGPGRRWRSRASRSRP